MSGLGKFLLILGSLLGILLIAGVAWINVKSGAAERQGLGISTAVRSGSELPEKTIEVLINENIIEPGDTVQYFYSYGVFSILEGGSVLTDKEVVIYEPGETGETDVYLLKLEDIRTIIKTVEGDFWTDEVYRISDSDPEAWIEIYLSVEDDKHLKFVEALYASTNTQKSDVKTE